MQKGSTSKIILFIISFVWFLLASHAEANLSCFSFYRKLNQNPKMFDITGIVFEPLSPRSPWGPNNQYNVDVRAGTALVINQVKGGIDNLNTLENFPFNARLFEYNDSPGNTMMGHFSLGKFYLNYIAGLQRLFDHYRRTMSAATADLLGIYSMVQTTFNSRTGVMSIWSEPGNNGDLIGFLRVFDGTEYKKLKPEAESWKEYYEPLLPVEFIFQQRNIKTSFFNNLRQENGHIFEIGKFFINEELNSENKKIVKKALLRFLKEIYLKPEYLIFKDKVNFIIHVGSVIHQKAYERNYGAKVINDPELNNQLKPGEALLMVDIKTLTEKLKNY